MCSEIKTTLIYRKDMLTTLFTFGKYNQLEQPHHTCYGEVTWDWGLVSIM